MANYPINTITDPTLQHNKTAEELIEINPDTKILYYTQNTQKIIQGDLVYASMNTNDSIFD